MSNNKIGPKSDSTDVESLRRLKELITNLVKEKPEKAAQILTEWMKQPPAKPPLRNLKDRKR